MITLLELRSIQKTLDKSMHGQQFNFKQQIKWLNQFWLCSDSEQSNKNIFIYMMILLLLLINKTIIIVLIVLSSSS